MMRKYVGDSDLIEKGKVCEVSYSYHQGYGQYTAMAVVPPYRKAVTLYYDTKEDREASWEKVAE